MEVAVGAAWWVVGKALGPVADGLLEAWAASKELGPNIDALKMELLYVQGMLNNTRGRDIDNPALNVLLQKLRDLAYNAEDVLDELDYFRIQDQLEGTYEAADEHDKGCMCNLYLNAHHTARAAGKLLCFCQCSRAFSRAHPSEPIEEDDTRQQVLCCAWPRAKRRSARGNISSAPHNHQANEEVSGCMRKLASVACNSIRHVGKLLHCSSLPTHDDVSSVMPTICGACKHKVSQKKHVKETPKLEFDRVDLSRRMRLIVEQLQPVCAKVATILNLELLGSSHTAPSSANVPRTTTSDIIEPTLYGREPAKKRIIDSITHDKYSGKDLTILPIVGPGGIGKTTLVQHIYHSHEVQKHFQVKVWICVSQNFIVSKLTEEIEKALPSVEDEKKGRAEELIEQRLKSKRFLFILDDLWKCESEDWKRLLVPLRKGQTNGNVILVTTRFPAIAEIVKTTDSSIILEGLEHREFRNFFRACIFGDEKSQNDHDVLLKIGDKIVEKLKGSPLAAKTVGRLLRNHLDAHHWTRVLESREWEMQTDYKFDSEELIHFWIGLDILHPGGGNKTVEDILSFEDFGSTKWNGAKGFAVNKETQGFELNQLEHLVKLRELGIYNLENVYKKEEAIEAKLIQKDYLHKLALDWDSKQPNTEPGVEVVVLESLQPHRNLQELSITGHRGPSCPTWLGDKLVVEALQSLYLSSVSWVIFPSFGKMGNLCELGLSNISTIKEFGLVQSFCKLVKKITFTGLENFEKWVPQPTHYFPHLQVLIIVDCPKLSELPFSSHIVYPLKQDWNIDWFPKLQELKIQNCPGVLLLPPIPWTRSLCSVEISNVGSKLLGELVYTKPSALEIDGKGGLHNLDQLLLFSKLTELQELRIDNCPPLELKYFLMLTSLKKLWAQSSNLGVVASEVQTCVEWQHPVDEIKIWFSDSSGRELTQFLSHLPKLSKLQVYYCKNITRLAVGVASDVPIVSSSNSLDVITMDDTQVKDEQQEIAEVEKEEANTVDDDGLLVLPAHLSNSLQALFIDSSIGVVVHSLEALQALTRLELEDCSFRHPFPSSLLHLHLSSVKGVLTLSNLTSLSRLRIYRCEEDFRCEGLLPLLTRGHLSKLEVHESPNFFGGWEWDPNPNAMRGRSSKLQEVGTDDIQGFLGAPALCSLLSSSLTELCFNWNDETARFTNEQEEAFQCLTSLQVLEFWYCRKLEHLPAALNKLTNLKIFAICACPALRSLPKDGLPSSLRELDVGDCRNEELTEHCKRWSLRLGVLHSSSLVELYIRIYGQLAYVRSSGNFSCQYIWCSYACSGWFRDTLELHFDGHSTRLVGVLISLFGCEDHNDGIYIADLLLNIRTFTRIPFIPSQCLRVAWSQLRSQAVINCEKTLKRFILINPAKLIVMNSYIRALF
ncbi:putative disease resistance protein RGA4 [Hordeum vulgare]|nr:putative disease resistance protein RGA4 [Hordeum vulgare]